MGYHFLLQQILLTQESNLGLPNGREIIYRLSHQGNSGITSLVQFLVTPGTVDCQAPLSMEFFWQEYWSALPFPPSGDLPAPGIEPTPPALAGGLFTTVPPWKPLKVWGWSPSASTDALRSCPLLRGWPSPLTCPFYPGISH